MKVLTLIRHAKSSWKHEGLADFERPLNGRGRRDAPFMAELFGRLPDKPDLLVSSHATRALTTARIFARYLDYPLEKLQLSEQIYEVGASALLDFVGWLPDHANNVAMFGHNPGFTDLLNLLTDENLENIPTTGIAMIELPVKQWCEVLEFGPGTAQRPGRMIYFNCPKQADS